MKIKCIALTASESGNDIYFYEVGSNGVTQIERIEFSPEPFAARFYYQIYKEGNLICELHQLTYVGYFEGVL